MGRTGLGRTGQDRIRTGSGQGRQGRMQGWMQGSAGQGSPGQG